MESRLKHMKTYISCPSPFMCRHIQPKKIQKNPKLGSSPREARRRAQRRRAGRGLEPNLRFFWIFFRLYMAAHKRGGAGNIWFHMFL